MQLHTKIFMFLLMVMSFCGLLQPAQAALSVFQNLDLGRWAITSNDSANSITVNPDGSYSSMGDVIMLDTPRQGVYDIDGLTPFVPITSITVSVVQNMIGGGQQFTMDDFQTTHTPVNGSGETRVFLGMTAHTSGNGTAYPDSAYNGILSIELNY